MEGIGVYVTKHECEPDTITRLFENGKKHLMGNSTVLSKNKSWDKECGVLDHSI